MNILEHKVINFFFLEKITFKLRWTDELVHKFERFRNEKKTNRSRDKFVGRAWNIVSE
jgi:hypothetical protein